MYPTHTHLIKYKNKYLGKNNYVFAFIKEHHAKQVADKLRYDSPIVKISPHTYVINRRLPVKNNIIEKKFLEVEKLQTSLGGFFTSINNMELKIIDEVLVHKNKEAIVLKSEFELENMVPLTDDDIVNHLDVLFHKRKHEDIDYLDEMSKIILERYIESIDDDSDEYYLEE